MMEKKNERAEEEREMKREGGAIVKLRRLKLQLVVLGVLAVVVLLVAGTIWSQNRKIQKYQQQLDEMINNPIIVSAIAPEISLEAINTELREIGELATMEYVYTDAAKFSDSKQIKNWNIPFTEKSFILKWDGVIKAGVDVNAIQVKANREKKILTIFLPEAEILSHDPDRSSVEVLNEKDGLFNKITLDDQVEFDVKSEAAMEARAIENGLLEKARKNAEAVILGLLSADPAIAGNYTVTFADLAE